LPQITAVLAGGILAWILVVVARRRSRDRAQTLYALALAIAAALYVVFVAVGAPERLPIEVAGFLLFGAIAWLGTRIWPYAVAGGWLVHIVWDVVLHPPAAGDGVPWWYPPLCIGFDVIVALDAARLAAGRKPW
jgi:hypothetical protein